MTLVSLTTDFGLKDYYVAELKSAILNHVKGVQIIDISHNIDKFDIVQAAFYLKNVLHTFPSDSIHVVGVYTHYKRESEIICFAKDGNIFIGPNNGVFSLVFEDMTSIKIYKVNAPNGNAISSNALLTHAIAYISHGLPLTEIGPELTSFHQKMLLKPVLGQHQIRASIIHIDNFENVIINLKKSEFEFYRNGRNFELYYKQHEPITQIFKHYGDVPIGDPVAFFNSADYLVLAVNLDKAASLYNLHKNEMIQIYFH
ncbi:MAG: SAM-dependent chlorinase/fluorinase [Saprospiraceae bacterium]